MLLDVISLFSLHGQLEAAQVHSAAPLLCSLKIEFEQDEITRSRTKETKRK